MLTSGSKVAPDWLMVYALRPVIGGSNCSNLVSWPPIGCSNCSIFSIAACHWSDVFQFLFLIQRIGIGTGRQGPRAIFSVGGNARRRRALVIEHSRRRALLVRAGKLAAESRDFLISLYLYE